MTCMMPIAPACDVMGFLSSSAVLPPLSNRITARIQASATPKRRDASLIRGDQRSKSCVGLNACSCANTDCALEATDATVLAKALFERANTLPARTEEYSSFTMLRDQNATIDHPVLRAGESQHGELDRTRSTRLHGGARVFIKEMMTNT